MGGIRPPIKKSLHQYHYQKIIVGLSLITIFPKDCKLINL